MSAEPTYVRQNGEPMTDEQCRAWTRESVEEARAKGCTWPRVSHDRETGAVLFEAWLERPHDEGEPRFAFVAVTP